MTAEDRGTTDLDVNRAVWTLLNERYTDGSARAAWAATEITWGLFAIPERELGLLGDVSGLDVVELGCGTAYFSAWLARRGARVVAVDLTAAQLATARRCQAEYGPTFPLLEADAQDLPMPDGCADLVVSEYGASVWCDPQRWLAEAARILRPGGRLVFLTNSVLLGLCVPADGGVAGRTLLRAQRGDPRVAWPDAGVEYHPSHGQWIAALRRHGFAVEALVELYAPDDAGDHEFYEIADARWARQWPVEDLWAARKEGTVTG